MEVTRVAFIEEIFPKVLAELIDAYSHPVSISSFDLSFSSKPIHAKYHYRLISLIDCTPKKYKKKKEKEKEKKEKKEKKLNKNLIPNNDFYQILLQKCKRRCFYDYQFSIK